MIGLDSPNLAHLRGALHRLPVMRRLFEGGAFFDLASSADVLDASAWPTFYTGTLPGEHGLYHPMQWDAAAMRMRRLAADWIYAEPFWYALGREGIPVVSVDVPMLLPATLPGGVEVRNWSTQENTGPLDASPPALAADVVRRFGSYPIGRDVPIEHSAARLDALRRTLVGTLPARTELTRWLLEQHPWRFAVTVFAECHRAGHNLWPETDDGAGEALLEVYEAIDRAIGELLGAVDLRHTTVVLFAAHSMVPNTSQSHLLQRIVERVNATFWQHLGRRAADGRSVLRLLRETVPPAVQLAVSTSLPGGVRDWVVDRAQRSRLDWRTTPALALVCGQNGLIRLNLAGRERDGFLAPGSELAARYVAWLRERLLELRATEPDAPLVAAVEEVAARYPGPRGTHLPDLAVRWTDLPPVMTVRSERLGTIRARFGTGRRGNHGAPAFAVVVAPERQAAAFRGLAHTADFAAAVTRCLAPQAERRFAR